MESGSLVLFRLDKLEKNVHDLRSETAAIPLTAQQVEILAEKVDTLTKAIITVGISFIVGTVGLAFTVFELLGRGG